MLRLFLPFTLCFLIGHHCSNNVMASNKPPLQHGKNFTEQAINLSEYWVSEKLDGVRGYWNGQQLISRQGKVINAPQWFTLHWPKHALDGEIWAGRNKFEQVISCINSSVKKHTCWQSLTFMVFDLPIPDITFNQRLTSIDTIVKQTASPYLKAVKQYKVSHLTALYQQLDQVITDKGEGLMLHKGSALYHVGRTKNLLKVKKYHDAEARVISHTPGKGKYLGMMGAIQVKTPEGIIFSLGTGFSDNERKSPPPIGSLITYRYSNKTAKGTPKFASFLRIKQHYLGK